LELSKERGEAAAAVTGGQNNVIDFTDSGSAQTGARIGSNAGQCGRKDVCYVIYSVVQQK